MPVAELSSANLYYETFGNADDPTVLLIAGLGTQLLFWEDEFCEGLVDRMFHVVRFDNRDVGLSSRFDGDDVDLGKLMAALTAGDPFEVPYTLSDMANDVAELITHLDTGPVHVLGVSLGGMVAQTLAAEHPDAVAGLALLSSTTGSPGVGQPTAEAFDALMLPSAEGREAIVEQNVSSRRIWATDAHWDEDWTRAYFAAAYDRAPDSRSDRQLGAAMSAPPRDEALAAITIPTLVMHGDADSLINPSGSEHLAELLADCEHLVLEGMAHDLPPHYWSQVIEALVRLAIRAL